MYSIGVLMLELLTAWDPVEMARNRKDLADEFVSAVEGKCVKEIIDSVLMEDDNMEEIQWFVRLALTCVAKKGEERPTMISVVEDLWMLQNPGNTEREILV